MEFLITLKIIGCISRRRKLLRADDKSYFLSKIWKDCYDVANLTSHLAPDGEKLLYHFKRTGLNKALIQEFLEICDGQKSALEEIGLKTCEFCGYTAHSEMVGVCRKTYQSI